MATGNAPTSTEKCAEQAKSDAVSSDEDGIWDDGDTNFDLEDFNIAVYTEFRRGVFVTAAEKKTFLNDRQSSTDRAPQALQVDAADRFVATPSTAARRKPLLPTPQPRFERQPIAFDKAHATVQPDSAFIKPNGTSTEMAELIMRIPNHLVGCIIGRRGQRIEDLRTSLKVGIKIAQVGRERGGVREVTVTGEQSRVIEAVKVLNEHIRQG